MHTKMVKFKLNWRRNRKRHGLLTAELVALWCAMRIFPVCYLLIYGRLFHRCVPLKFWIFLVYLVWSHAHFHIHTQKEREREQEQERERDAHTQTLYHMQIHNMQQTCVCILFIINYAAACVRYVECRIVSSANIQRLKLVWVRESNGYFFIRTGLFVAYFNAWIFAKLCGRTVCTQSLNLFLSLSFLDFFQFIWSLQKKNIYCLSKTRRSMLMNVAHFSFFVAAI